jgi:hypothetical protein
MLQLNNNISNILAAPQLEIVVLVSNKFMIIQMQQLNFTNSMVT